MQIGTHNEEDHFVTSRILIIASLLVALACGISAADHVVLKQDGRELQISGKVLVTAEDGGLLLLGADGQLWPVEAKDLVSRKTEDEPFVPLSQEQLTKQMLAELPAGFDVHATAHYLICYNTSRAYAQWVGTLYERLFAGFTNYWSRRGFKLHAPQMPLVVLVFADQSSYVDHVRGELAEAAPLIVGYYSLRSNRVNMYDLTGVEAIRAPASRRGSSTQINQMLARPEAEAMVATIIHEATHQIAFNCGLHARFADIPLWVSEGIAVYFESPDLRSSKGWRTIGTLHHSRLAQFRQYLAKRPADSLRSLIADDTRMRDPRQAADAYAEAWALNYYLIRQRPKEYLSYLETLSAKGPLVWDDAATRLQQFQAAFGPNLTRLDAEFLRYLQGVR